MKKKVNSETPKNSEAIEELKRVPKKYIKILENLT